MSVQTTESGGASSTVQKPVPKAPKRRRLRILVRLNSIAGIARRWVLARRRRVAAALVLVLMGIAAFEPQSSETGGSSFSEFSWSDNTDPASIADPDDSFFENYFEALPEFPEDSAVSSAQQSTIRSPGAADIPAAVQPPEVPAMEPLDMSSGMIAVTGSPSAVPQGSSSNSDDPNKKVRESIVETAVYPAESNENQPAGLVVPQDSVRPVKFRGTIVPLTK